MFEKLRDCLRRTESDGAKEKKKESVACIIELN